MKRTFTAIVCTLLLVAVLAGCGSTNPLTPRPRPSPTRA